MFDSRIISKKLLPIFKPSLHRIMQAARPHAMISRNRMQNLDRLLHQIERERIPGDVVETGVARGGSAILLATRAIESKLDREVWLYDAFELLDAGDGPCAYLADVEALIHGACRLPRDRVHVIRGLFEDTLPEHPERPISLLHIDAGYYDVNKTCLDHLFAKISHGGWLVVDNYGVCPHCRRAVDERLHSEGLAVAMQRFNHTQAYVQKTHRRAA
jgi:O-methyltransferase